MPSFHRGSTFGASATQPCQSERVMPVRASPSYGFPIQCKAILDELAEALIGRKSLKARVEADRGGDVSVAKHPAGKLEVSGVMAENEGCRRMPEHVGRGPEASALEHDLGNVGAGLGSRTMMLLAGKQPILPMPWTKMGPEHLNEPVYQRAGRGTEGEAQASLCSLR